MPRGRPKDAVPGVSGRCAICNHVDRARIEAAVARGVSRRDAAMRFDVSADSIYRHYNNHVSEDQKVALKTNALKPRANLLKLVEQEDQGLLESLSAIRAGLWTLFESAVGLEDRSNASRLAAQLNSNLETVAKLTGELRPHASTQVLNLTTSPDYLRLRQRLVMALRPYPDALGAVIEAFRGVEADAAAELKAAMAQPPAEATTRATIECVAVDKPAAA